MPSASSPRSVNHFFADDRLRRIFSFQSLYAGLAPYQALALYAVIAYMDAINGVYVPVGGMHALPVALAGAAEKAGVEFRYNTAVARILLAEGTRGAVRGVRLADGHELAARPLSATLTCPSRTERSFRGCRHRASRVAAGTRRRPSSGTQVLPARSRPVSPTTTSISVANGTHRSAR